DIYTRSGSTFTRGTILDMMTYGMSAGGKRIYDMDYHPNANYLAVASQGATGGYGTPIILKDPAGTPVVLSDGAHGISNHGISTSVAWSPDGTFLAAALFGSPALAVYGFDKNTDIFSSATLSGTNCATPAAGVAWSPDGNY